MPKIKITFTLALFSMTLLPVAAQSALLRVGTPAPDFTAQAWSGASWHLADYKGKIVVLDFWASWCGPCNEAMPNIENVHSFYKDDGVVVLGLCVSDTRAAASKWIKAHPQYTFTFAYDPTDMGQDSIALPYHVDAIPTTYIIDKEGTIAAVGTDMGWDDIHAALSKLGAKSTGEKAALKEAQDRTENGMYSGEIKLHGTITLHADGQKLLVLAAQSITLPTGETHPFEKPRLKNIIVDTPMTFVVSSGKALSVNDLKPGQEVDVTGKDTGVGKDLKARRVKILQ